MSSMLTHHIHLAFKDIPVAIFLRFKKSMKGMGVRAQLDTVKFLVRVHYNSDPFYDPFYQKFLE
jgi:hypothetical protein